MDRVTRRTVVTGGVGSTLFLSGCLDGWNLFVNPEDRKRQQLSQTTVDETIRKDQFYAMGYEFAFPVEIEYEFEVRDGSNVDVLVLPEEEFSLYRTGRTFESVDSASELDASEGAVSTHLSEGRYRLVIDNTDQGEVSPLDDEDSVAITLEFTSYVV